VVSAVCERLRERAVQAPGAPALVACVAGRATVWTWAELERRTGRLAETVSAAVRRPGRCALLAAAGNDADAVAELVAMLRTDLPVAVLARTAPEAEVLMVRDELLRAGYDVIRLTGGNAVLSESTAAVRAALPAESVLLATGGSSGRPKLVVDTRMRTVARRPAATRPSAVMNWRPGQRQVVIGPLYHAAALTFFIEGLCDGNTLIVSRSFEPASVLAAIGEWRAEWLSLTPYHLRHLAIAAIGSPADLATVRGVLHLAAPCPHRLKRHVIDLFGARRVFEMYGCTEGIGVTVLRGDEWLRRPGTVGRGYFTQIRVLDQVGERLPPGRSGEIYLRSGSPGRRPYLRAGDEAAGATMVTFAKDAGVTVDGFTSVGDRGWQDDDGYLYLEPRQLSRIQVGGETVDPGEVESLLMEHPDVLDAAVRGVPDERLGECLVALVVPAGGQDARVLRWYLREHVARHKVPRVVRFVGRLPRSEAGKLDRRALAAFAAATGASQVPSPVGPREAAGHGEDEPDA
jgi:bile acid-coenzyme A ligase